MYPHMEKNGIKNFYFQQTSVEDSILRKKNYQQTKKNPSNFNPGLNKEMIKVANSPEVVTAWF